MSPQLESVLISYYTLKMLSPLIIIGAFIIVFLVAAFLDQVTKVKWCIQKKRLILRPNDLFSEKIPKYWDPGKGHRPGCWMPYNKSVEDLSWWEKNVLLDEKF